MDVPARRRWSIVAVMAVAGVMTPRPRFISPPAHAGAYLFTEFPGQSPDLIVHPSGYRGSRPVGGVLKVRVGVRPAVFSDGALQDIVRAMATWNAKQATVGNFLLGQANDIPPGRVDFQSTVLHELGHALGLAHNNAAFDSGLPVADTDYGRALAGINRRLDIGPGPDGIRGTVDDLRGDDINLNWADAGLLPFTLPAGVIDRTTLFRRETFPNIGSRQVAGSAAFVLIPDNTEAVMNQGAFFDEAQRTLTADDVSVVLLAETGLDGRVGGGDDYEVRLVWAGEAASAESVDVFLDLNVNTGFATSTVRGMPIPDVVGVRGVLVWNSERGIVRTPSVATAVAGPAHMAVVSAEITFALPDTIPWHFGPPADCNGSGMADLSDIALGASEDCNKNGVPDECDGGDLDGSQTVDLADLGGLIRCLQGPCDRMGCQAPIVEGVCCNVADTDVDRDVDLADVARFQRMFGRP